MFTNSKRPCLTTGAALMAPPPAVSRRVQEDANKGYFRLARARHLSFFALVTCFTGRRIAPQNNTMTHTQRLVSNAIETAKIKRQ